MQWLTNGLNFVKGLPNVVYLAIGAVALLGVAYGGGYLVGSRAEARIQVEKVYVPVKEIQEVQVRNVQRERELQESLRLAQNRAASLQLRLHNVPANNCAVDPDAVGVLNEAITGSPATDPAGVPAGTSTTVTDLTNWSFGAIVQYNDVSTRYNALIDWVEDELIEPQSK